MIIKQYITDLTSNELFCQFESQNHVMFLDSARDKETLGQYSILVANPRMIIESKGNEILVDGKKIDEENPFEALQKLLNMYSKNYKTELPFIGGFVGFLSYDLKAFIEK